MLEDKKIEEAKKNAIKSINSGAIVKTKEPRYVDFFIKNAKDSLDSAKVLFDISVNEKTKNTIGIPNFNGFLWVINSSYYSMFYMTRALLESVGVKIKTGESIHFLVSKSKTVSALFIIIYECVETIIWQLLFLATLLYAAKILNWFFKDSPASGSSTIIIVSLKSFIAFNRGNIASP